MDHKHTIPTGFQALDEVLGGGVHGGSLTVIASRPGMGKTTVFLRCAAGMAKNTDQKIYIFSMELSSDDIKKKFSRMNARSSIIIDDSVPVTPSRIRAKLAGIPDLGAVLIDYVQLLRPDENACAQSISEELKMISKELGVPIICNAQLSRAAGKGEGRRPALRDLRFSGMREKDADVVIFLHRDAYHPSKEPAGPPSSEVIVAKNRYGSLRNFFISL